MLINPLLDTESDIIWLCDGCGETLNIQEGFGEDCEVFVCRNCGFKNRISEDEIYNMIFIINHMKKEGSHF